MSKSRQRTTPDFALNSPVHIKARENRNDALWDWKKNVVDQFKGKTDEEIRASLKETRFPFSVLVENLLGDFNLSSVLRNLNAFNGDALYYTGDKHIDRRGSVGCHAYSDLFWLPTIDTFKDLKTKFNKIVAADNIPGAIPFRESKVVPETMFVFGNEGVGITKEMLDLCDEVVMVPQYGSVRSINVACCSAIIMEHYVSEIERNADKWFFKEWLGGGKTRTMADFREFHRIQKLQSFE